MKKRNMEHYKWLWLDASLPQRDKIIEEVAARADLEILIWFWQDASPPQRDKILQAMNRAEKSQSVAPEKEDRMGTSSESQYEYDIFICHASEDKEPFVRILAEKLYRKGLRVWYDEFTLSLGDNLRRSIDYGLAKSRYGVVVLSTNFFEKEWPQKELDALVAREDGLEKVILPIWHGVTKEQIQSFSPVLADRLSVHTDKGIDYVVDTIFKVVSKENHK